MSDQSETPPPKTAWKPSTQVTHLGRHPTRHLGAVNTPVYRASTILFETVADIERVERGEYPGISYGLHGLPTVTDLQDAYAALEGAHACLSVSSGLAAMTLALLALTRSGDHILVSDSVYGPTRRFCNNQLARFGVDVTYYDPLAGSGIASQLRPKTKLVFVESPGSLTFEVQDVPAIAEAAHRNGAIVLMDNTWATPLFFRAFEHGVDVSLHAGTKYLGGHADIFLGLISCSKETYPRLHRLWTDMGVAASADDCFLGLRGLRTMALRLAQHQRSALTIADWLRKQPAVEEVVYPALPGARGHELWKRDFKGASGLFGVILKPAPKAAVDAMLNGMDLFKMGWSWGGYESLILPTDPRRVRTVTQWNAAGPYLRLNVGLEDPDDLVADLAAGLERLGRG